MRAGQPEAALLVRVLLFVGGLIRRIGLARLSRGAGAVGVDLGDAMLDCRSDDFFGVLAIANLAIDADELASAL